mmetsp:Transcript_47409/g.151855  ORF Transcript_47409/g.151855 Transcript_47409/m.151855 type:complete len:83 (-) Transcript_47409:1897-2145(-)
MQEHGRGSVATPHERNFDRKLPPSIANNVIRFVDICTVEGGAKIDIPLSPSRLQGYAALMPLMTSSASSAVIRSEGSLRSIR